MGDQTTRRAAAQPPPADAALDPELLEFLDDDAPAPPPDPAFRERLRLQLSDLVERLYGSRGDSRGRRASGKRGR